MPLLLACLSAAAAAAASATATTARDDVAASSVICVYYSRCRGRRWSSARPSLYRCSSSMEMMARCGCLSLSLSQALDEANKNPEFALCLVYFLVRGETMGLPVPVRQVRRRAVATRVCTVVVAVRVGASALMSVCVSVCVCKCSSVRVSCLRSLLARSSCCRTHVCCV
jgi:hypothetical protein